MRILFLFLIMILIVSPAFSQDSVWTNVYIPAVDDYSDVLNGGCVTSDGNYVFAGYTTSFQIWTGDCYLMKINTDGDTVWTGTYGNPYRDYGSGVVETYDGGLAAVGFGRINNESEEYRVRLYRTDAMGVQLWDAAYNNVNGCNAHGMAETSDRGFAIVGYTGPYGNYDMYIMRADSVGDSMWLVTYGGPEDDIANAVAATDNKGYIVAGGTNSYGAGSSDIYVIGVDSLSEISWSKTFGDTLFDVAFGVEKTSDGSFVVVGSKIFPDPIENRMYLIKIDDVGDTAWTTSIYGGTGARGRAVCEANDGGFIMVGDASYGYPKDEDVFIAKVDANGDSVWAVHYGGDSHDVGRFVHQDDGGYIYVGVTYATSDYCALKLYETPVGVEFSEDPHLPGAFSLDQNTPNPFNATTAIKYYIPRGGHAELTIYNLLGQEVKTLVDKSHSAGYYTVFWDGTDTEGNDAASGTYLYRLKMGDLIQSKQMILLK